MKLYEFALSGNSHKVRLLLSFLGISYVSVPVDLPGLQNRMPEFLRLNPLGMVPVLDDDGFVLRDSQAILMYLAKKAGATDWLPEAADDLGRVMQWLSFAANEIFHGPMMARAVVKFGRKADLDLAQERARKVLEILDARLRGHDWVALDHPTIADLACYPYAGLVLEGEIPIDPYPGVQAWIKRIEALPGYVGMDGLGR